MKVNLKKIGAIVAGATILASSVAFAGLWFGNTELVNNNGAPAVKVVVGEGAAASDGVAAANIAAKIASEAFKQTTFTAQVTGDATCTAGGTVSGAGTCAVSNEKATLEITVPGSAQPGTYSLKTLIADITDRTILDRGSGTLRTYSITTAETSEEAHPFSNGSTGGTSSNSLSGVSNQELYRIDGAVFEPFKEKSFTDSDAGKTYKTKQYLFVNAHNQYRDSADGIQGRFRDFVYQVKFTHDNFGIPVCTQSTNKSWASCGTSSTDHTQNHKVKVSFLGSPWVITKIESPTTVVGDETQVISGGEVDLAKESISGIVNVGEKLDAPNGYSIWLDDIKEGSTASEQSAIVSIKDANGALVKQTTIAPGVTQTVTTTSGEKILIRVFKTAPGYTFGAKWADMAIISNELILKDGDVVEVNGDRVKNDKWKVRLAWKNKDVDNSLSGQGNVTDHLRSILIYRDISDFFGKGDGYNLLEDPLGFKFTYKGLDLNPSSSDDYDQLRFEVIDLGTSGFTYVADGSTTTTREANASMYVKLTSEYGFSTNVGTGKEIRVLFYSVNTGDTDGITPERGLNLTKSTATGFSSGAILVPGTVMLKLDGSPERWVFVGYTNNTIVENTTDQSSNNLVRIDYLGAGSAGSEDAGGEIVMSYGATGSVRNASNTTNSILGATIGTGDVNYSAANANSSDSYVFVVSEDAGESLSAQKPDSWAVFFNVSAKSFNKDSANGLYLKDKFRVASTTAMSATNVSHDLEGNVTTQREVGFTTHRGTMLKEISDTVVTAKVPRQKVAKSEFLLATSEVAAAGTSGYQVTLGEGEEYAVPGTGGVVIKVTEISEDVGACAVGPGATPSCTVDQSGVSGVVLANGKDPRSSYAGGAPYGYEKFGGPLVVLDSDASDVDVLVTVGGPAVNKVTKDVLSGSSVDFNTEPKVIKEVVAGKKIVVAGLTASDTLEAAKDFISALRSQ